VSLPATGEQAGFETVATLRVNTGPLAGPVLTRVVSMVLARANCPVDRLDDAMLVCDALTAHAPAHSNDGHLAFELARSSSALELRVSALSPSGARELVEDSVIPGLGNVLERVSDELRFEPDPAGIGEDLVLELNFA
jgi:hypothetical protein